MCSDQCVSMVKVKHDVAEVHGHLVIRICEVHEQCEISIEVVPYIHIGSIKAGI